MMTKEKVIQLQESIKELKEIKAQLMGWNNADGYTLDSTIEAFLKGFLEAQEWAGAQK